MDGSVCSSSGCEMPSWFVSIHKRNEEKTASRESMMPSPLPPLFESSYTARAAKPLGVLEAGCGVKLPNNCLPLWTKPSPPGKTKKALLEFAAVQPICTGWFVPEMSNNTPPAAVVRLKPFPLTSMTTGEVLQAGGSALGSVQQLELQGFALQST